MFIVCDGGWKYLSTGAYTDDLDAAEAAAEKYLLLDAGVFELHGRDGLTSS